MQRHIQLRIEAQGQYLQSVLKKAQETLSEYGSCSIEADHVKDQLSKLVSMVNSGCPNSSFSALTQSENSMMEDRQNKLLGHHGCSHESSLTSSENGSESRAKNIEQSNSRRFPLLEDIDLNCKSTNDFDPGPKMIDLNSKGEENF